MMLTTEQFVELPADSLTMGMVTSVTLYRHPWRSKPCTVATAAARPGPLLERTCRIRLAE